MNLLVVQLINKNETVPLQFEQERGHIASAVECYMKQHGVEEQEAEDELKKRVDDAWKDINEECLRLTAVPTHVLTRIVNSTRMLDVIYKDGDCYTHSETTKMRDIISSLLIHPVASEEALPRTEVAALTESN